MFVIHCNNHIELKYSLRNIYCNCNKLLINYIKCKHNFSYLTKQFDNYCLKPT